MAGIGGIGDNGVASYDGVRVLVREKASNAFRVDRTGSALRATAAQVSSREALFALRHSLRRLMRELSIATPGELVPPAPIVSSSALELSALDENKKIRNVAAFNSITSGSILINGQSIQVNINSDSLLDILADISANVPGLSATYNSSARKVTLISSVAQNLTLDSNGTGFFEALHITSTTYQAQSREGGPDADLVRKRARAVEQNFPGAGSALGLGAVGDLVRLAKIQGLDYDNLAGSLKIDVDRLLDPGAFDLEKTTKFLSTLIRRADKELERLGTGALVSIRL